MLKALCTILFLPTAIIAFGQGSSENTFEAYELMQKSAEVNDSVTASKYLQDVSPYYLLFLHQAPEKLDSFFNKYQITAKGRKQYKPIFDRAYNKNKSALYDTLQAMQKAYLKLRYSLDTCKASSEDYYLGQIQKADTPRFHFVYNNIKENGWPSIEDGALYAGEIVTRDYIHYRSYDSLNNITSEKYKMPFNVSQKRDYANLMRQNHLYLLLKSDYLSYDVSELLANQLPERANTIGEDVRRLCPPKKVMMIYEGRNAGAFEKAMKHMKTSQFEATLSLLQKVFSNACRFYDGSALYSGFYNGRKNEK